MNRQRREAGRARRPGRSRRPALEALDARQLPSGLVATAGHVGFIGRTDHRAAMAADHGAGMGRVVPGITYTSPGQAPQQLDLYLPAGHPPPGGWPTILAFPGGGWRWSSRQQYGEQVAALTKFGFAVAGVGYTFASNTPDGSHAWPTDLQDAQQAVRWARANAGRYHLNPDQLVAMGDSAGANLALLVGDYPAGPVLTNAPPSGPSPTPGQVSDRVAAVVDFYGPTDLAPLYDQSRPQVLPFFDTFLGGTPAQYPGRYAAASPLTYVNPTTPPTLIVQGMMDRTNIPGQSLALDAALTKAGVPHQLIAIPWASHGFGLDLVGYNLAADVAAFLHAALQGRPIPEAPTHP